MSLLPPSNPEPNRLKLNQLIGAATIISGTASKADAAQCARETLQLAELAVNLEDSSLLVEITDHLLPYISQWAPSGTFIRSAQRCGEFLLRAGESEDSATWYQYAAIRFRHLRRYKPAKQCVQKAIRALDHDLHTHRLAYCLLTSASLDTRTKRFLEAQQSIQRVRDLFPISDSTLSLHAQADMELTRLYAAIERGETALFHAEQSSFRFHSAVRTKFADPVIQGFMAEAYYLCGRYDRAYISGIRAVTPMLLSVAVRHLREVSGPVCLLASSGIYGFKEEWDLAAGLEKVLTGGPMSAESFAETQRAASKLYLFYLDNLAGPVERYDSTLEVECVRALGA